MSLSHDAFTFGNHLHGMPVERPFEPQLEVGRWFGVVGESHLIGETWGREIEIPDYTLTGYANVQALEAARNTLHAKIGKLTGTLSVTISGSTMEFPKTTFLGFQPYGPPFLDGSGVNGWCQFGTLMFRQRAID